MNTENSGLALPKCAVLTKKEAKDADIHAANLTHWQQEYDQMSRGNFYGHIVELPLEGLQVFKEHTNQALRQKCEVLPDSIWIGLSAKQQKHSRINGLLVDNTMLMCQPGDCDFELMTPASFDIFGVVVKKDYLINMAAIQGLQINFDDLFTDTRLRLPQKTVNDLQYILNRLLSNKTLHSPEHIQYDIVMMAMMEILQKQSCVTTPTLSYRHRKSVVDQVRDITLTRKDEPITITDLCAITNVSRRTLQYSFESIVGISPIQFLRISRLNAVRRELKNTSRGASIADIASNWGFWHFSQFSKDYSTLFGELPSTTRSRYV